MRRLSTAGERSFAVTGPWPPYNFVCCDASKPPARRAAGEGS